MGTIFPPRSNRTKYAPSKGNFSVDTAALPVITSTGQNVKAADMDGDGDLDLFVGGFCRPGSYPEPADSLLARNDSGRFVAAWMLERVGLVTGSVMCDLDGDGHVLAVNAEQLMNAEVDTVTPDTDWAAILKTMMDPAILSLPVVENVRSVGDNRPPAGENGVPAGNDTVPAINDSLPVPADGLPAAEDILSGGENGVASPSARPSPRSSPSCLSRPRGARTVRTCSVLKPAANPTL